MKLSNQPTDRPINLLTDRPTDRPTEIKVTNYVTRQNRALCAKFIFRNLLNMTNIFLKLMFHTILVFATLNHKNLFSFCQLYYIKMSYILILFSNLRLNLPSFLCPSGIPTQNTYVRFSSPMHATCPAVLASVKDSLRWCLLRSSNRDPLHHVMCPSCMFLTLSCVYIHFSAPWSPTHTEYASH
jgi:hypothetical protein